MTTELDFIDVNNIKYNIYVRDNVITAISSSGLYYISLYDNPTKMHPLINAIHNHEPISIKTSDTYDTYTLLFKFSESNDSPYVLHGYILDELHTVAEDLNIMHLKSILEHLQLLALKSM